MFHNTHKKYKNNNSKLFFDIAASVALPFNLLSIFIERTHAIPCKCRRMFAYTHFDEIFDDYNVTHVKA